MIVMCARWHFIRIVKQRLKRLYIGSSTKVYIIGIDIYGFETHYNVVILFRLSNVADKHV